MRTEKVYIITETISYKKFLRKNTKKIINIFNDEERAIIYYVECLEHNLQVSEISEMLVENHCDDISLEINGISDLYLAVRIGTPKIFWTREVAKSYLEGEGEFFYSLFNIEYINGKRNTQLKDFNDIFNKMQNRLALLEKLEKRKVIGYRDVPMLLQKSCNNQ